MRTTGRVVVFDDSNRTCGFAAELSALFAEEVWDALRAPVRRVTRADVPVPFSTPLETYVLPSADRLLDACHARPGTGEGMTGHEIRIPKLDMDTTQARAGGGSRRRRRGGGGDRGRVSATEGDNRWAC